jgi:hypothetical protein
MAALRLSEDELRLAWKTLHENNGNLSKAASELGIARDTLRHRLEQGVQRLGEEVKIPHVTGKKRAMRAKPKSLPREGEVKRYLCTSAQSFTHLHTDVWENLLALGNHYEAEILVSRFTYKKESYGPFAVKPGKHKSAAEQQDFFPPEITDYIADERLELAPGLVWCGEIQMLPTARRPLSSFEDYTGRASSIIPHPAIAMESVASGKHEATKFLYTTGCVTQRNYIQRREGFRAEHVHAYGALLVEVDHKGNWWCRQIVAGPDDDLQDLDVVVKSGRVKTGQRVQDITFGDVHVKQLTDEGMAAQWGPDGLLDRLKPFSQHLHDVLDFTTRSHHTRKDPWEVFLLSVRGQHRVDDELDKTASFLKRAARSWCDTRVVHSNHHEHLDRWLKEEHPNFDPSNAIEWLSLNLAHRLAVKGGEDNFYPFAHAMRQRGVNGNVRFLQLDEDSIILKEQDGGIDCSHHGYYGANGTKGAASGYAKMGRRTNIADKHYARIFDGCYQAGESPLKEQRYVKGPSSRSVTHIVTYPNGSRALLTYWDGKFYA